MQIVEYKCPNCGGVVKFDTSTQKMKCPSCDTEFEIKALEEFNKELSLSQKDRIELHVNTAGKAWDARELDDLSTGSCPSCGAELIGDANTVAMVCPSCGNTQIVMRRLEGMLKPNVVIPFKLEKKFAIEALHRFYEINGKRLLPNYFKEENQVKKLLGAYLPFWLFDTKAEARIVYKATKVRTWHDSSYNYRKTDYYSVFRDGGMAFEKVPVDGSEKMDNAYMDSIEPFEYRDIRNFEPAYLSGYIAEKYDVDAEKSKSRAGQRMKNSIEREFARSVTGYNSVTVVNSNVNIADGKVNYALLPVYVLNTKYKGENYQFLINGQNGRLAGKLPFDPLKAWFYRILISAITGLGLIFIIELLRIFV